MKTIRRYSNVAEAGFAQSLLVAAGLEATLADEHAATMGLQFAPWGIRLEVPDAEAERALEILNLQAGPDPLPRELIPSPGPEIPPFAQETIVSILAEVQRLRRNFQIAATVGILLFGAAMIFIPGQLRPPPAPRQFTGDSWAKVQTFIDHFEYDKAIAMTQRIIAKFPGDYYGYVYLGQISLATGNLQDSQRSYARAYQLFPGEENEKQLRAVQKRLEAESSK